MFQLFHFLIFIIADKFLQMGCVQVSLCLRKNHTILYEAIFYMLTQRTWQLENTKAGLAGTAHW